MYKIFTENKTEKKLNGTFTTFSAAKNELNQMFNQEMWRGNICQWNSPVSYMGRYDDSKTYIKKIDTTM